MTFEKNISPPSSASKNMPSKKPVLFYALIWIIGSSYEQDHNMTAINGMRGSNALIGMKS
jgi:hypothetical protein